MSQPDPNAAGLASNELETTEAERAALALANLPNDATGADAAPNADTAKGAQDPVAQGGAAPAGAVEGAPVAAAQPEQQPAVAAEGGLAAPAQAMAAPAAFVPTYNTDDRDYGAEITAVNQQLIELKAKYKSGDVEDEQYEDAYERLRDQRSNLERAQDRAELQATLNQQNADQAWAYLQRQFLGSPENAAIASSPLLFAAWEQGMQVVADAAAKEGRQVTDWDLLVGGRQQLVDAGMLGTAATPAQAPAAAAPPPPNRAAPLAQVPQTLSAVPAAADPSSRTTSESAAEQGIEDLEAYLASKPEAERDRILRELPGEFVND